MKRINSIGAALIQYLGRHGHKIHRVSLGLLVVWFGLLKPLGHETTTSLLTHTIYWGDPSTMVRILGWWEGAVGVCLLVRPLLRAALLLLALRLPGILLAFILEPATCFVSFPFAPTPEGQYRIKDRTLFFAALAVAGFLGEESQRTGPARW